MSVLTQTFFTFVSRHFMSLSFLSARHIIKYYLVTLFFTRLRKVFEGLNAGMLWAGIIMVSFFEMLRAVFWARTFAVKLPKPLKYTLSFLAIESLTDSMKASTTLCTFCFSRPVVLATSFTISALVLLYCNYMVYCQVSRIGLQKYSYFFNLQKIVDIILAQWLTY